MRTMACRTPATVKSMSTNGATAGMPVTVSTIVNRVTVWISSETNVMVIGVEYLKPRFERMKLSA